MPGELFALVLCRKQAEARNLQVNCGCHFPEMTAQPDGILTPDQRKEDLFLSSFPLVRFPWKGEMNE